MVGGWEIGRGEDNGPRQLNPGRVGVKPALTPPHGSTLQTHDNPLEPFRITLYNPLELPFIRITLYNCPFELLFGITLHNPLDFRITP